MPAPPPHRLDEHMDARRLDLRMTWRQVADAAGISAETIRAIRRGDNTPGGVTKSGLEDALHWERGSIDSILDDGAPVPISERPAGRGHALPDDDPTRRILDAALEQLTPEQQEAFLRQELERRQRRGRKPSRADDVRRRA